MRCRPLGPRPVFVLAMAESIIVAAAVGWQVPLDGPVKVVLCGRAVRVIIRECPLGLVNGIRSVMCE
jgi:hypothetical protein